MVRKASRQEALEVATADLDSVLRPSFDLARSAFENSLEASRAWTQGWVAWCEAATPGWPSQWAAQVSLLGAQSALGAIEQMRNMMEAMTRVWAPSFYDTSLPD